MLKMILFAITFILSMFNICFFIAIMGDIRKKKFVSILGMIVYFFQILLNFCFLWVIIKLL